MAAYNCPRYTKDLDLWINNDIESAITLYKVLCKFGFTFDESFINEWQIKPKIIILGTEPNRVDILNQPKGIDFNICYFNRNIAKYKNLDLSFISKKDLILNKQAVGRPQDLVDIINLLNN